MNILKEKEIERLLVRFEQGETSEAEETRLRDFFRQTDDIPSAWEPYRELFQSFETSAYDFSGEELDAMLETDDSNSDIPVSATHVHGPKIRPFRGWQYVAAAVVVCAFGLSAVYYLNSLDTPRTSVERQTAFRATKTPSHVSVPEHAPRQMSLAQATAPSDVVEEPTKVAAPMDVAEVVPSSRPLAGSSVLQDGDTHSAFLPETTSAAPSSVSASLAGTVSIAGAEIIVADTHWALAQNLFDVPVTIQPASFIEAMQDTACQSQSIASSSQAVASASAPVSITYNRPSSIALALPHAQLMPGNMLSLDMQ